MTGVEAMTMRSTARCQEGRHRECPAIGQEVMGRRCLCPCHAPMPCRAGVSVRFWDGRLANVLESSRQCVLVEGHVGNHVTPHPETGEPFEFPNDRAW